MYVTNVSKTLSTTVLVNLYLLIRSICRAIGIFSEEVYVFQINFVALNFEFTALKDRKYILRTTSMLVSASKKLFSRNQALLNLTKTKDSGVIILWVVRAKLSIYQVSTIIV